MNHRRRAASDRKRTTVSPSQVVAHLRDAVADAMCVPVTVARLRRPDQMQKLLRTLAGTWSIMCDAGADRSSCRKGGTEGRVVKCSGPLGGASLVEECPGARRPRARSRAPAWRNRTNRAGFKAVW